MDSQTQHDLRILEQIERDPDLTQADLAARLGVAVGSVNWYIKRLIHKGYVVVTRMQRRRLRYLLTPKGMAEKSIAMSLPTSVEPIGLRPGHPPHRCNANCGR